MAQDPSDVGAREPLSAFKINTYEVCVPLDLSVFDSVSVAKLSVAETVAGSIVESVDELDQDDTSYVSTQVEYDEESLEDAFDDDDVGIAMVDTQTRLAIVGDDDD